MIYKKFFFAAFLIFASAKTREQTYLSVPNELIKRALPKQHQAFLMESIITENGIDVFEIESKKNTIILWASSGVAIASGFYYYLTEYARCQITWEGINLKLPNKPPIVKTKSENLLHTGTFITSTPALLITACAGGIRPYGYKNTAS
jgi:alpha-N-acetylglucosaminidase